MLFLCLITSEKIKKHILEVKVKRDKLIPKSSGHATLTSEGKCANGESMFLCGLFKMYYFIFYLFLLLFKYSCLHFPPSLFPAPLTPTSHPQSYLPLLCPWVLYTCSLTTLPLLCPIIPLLPPLWSLSVCSLFQCLWLYCACLFC